MITLTAAEIESMSEGEVKAARAGYVLGFKQGYYDLKSAELLGMPTSLIISELEEKIRRLEEGLQIVEDGKASS